MKKRSPEELAEIFARAEVYLSNRVWSVERIAEALGYKRSTFSIAFKKHVGIPPIAYRLEKAGNNMPYESIKAMRYLRQTSLHLKEVAHRSGFRSYDTFRTRFKKDVGLSPGKYREQFANKGGHSKAAKLEEAMALLSAANMSVAHVA